MSGPDRSARVKGLKKNGLNFRLGLLQACDAIAGLPLAAFFHQFDSLETLEYITFSGQRAGAAETAML